MIYNNHKFWMKRRRIETVVNRTWPRTLEWDELGRGLSVLVRQYSADIAYGHSENELFNRWRTSHNFYINWIYIWPVENKYEWMTNMYSVNVNSHGRMGDKSAAMMTMWSQNCGNLNSILFCSPPPIPCRVIVWVREKVSRVNHNGSLKCQIPLTDANTANYTSHNWADGPMAGWCSSRGYFTRWWLDKVTLWWQRPQDLSWKLWCFPVTR